MAAPEIVPEVLEPESTDPAEGGAKAQRKKALRAFVRNRLSLVGAGLILLLVIAAIFAPWIAPRDPLAQDVVNRLSPPSSEFLFGTDGFGRDLFTRVLYGARVSLMVGVLSVLFGGGIGGALGIVAGYLGGRVEAAIMRTMDVLMSFPDLITGLVVLAVIGGGLRNLIIAISITIIPRFARFAHAPTLALRGAEYVESAVAIGASSARVMRRHVFPNVRGELLVLASLWTATAIRVEANLSFIGLGVAPPTPTWGQMIREGMPYLANAPWHSVLPGLAILVAVLGFNLIGDGLRDALDPRTRSSR
jgi:peptide/nickel transport system permease protein